MARWHFSLCLTHASIMFCSLATTPPKLCLICMSIIYGFFLFFSEPNLAARALCPEASSTTMEMTVSCITCQQHYAVEGCTRKQPMKDTLGQKPSLVQFSLLQNGIYTLSKALMCSIPSLRRFPNVTFEIVPMFV